MSINQTLLALQALADPHMVKWKQEAEESIIKLDALMHQCRGFIDSNDPRSIKYWDEVIEMYGRLYRCHVETLEYKS